MYGSVQTSFEIVATIPASLQHTAIDFSLRFSAKPCTTMPLARYKIIT
jgi:hypothetical protein